MRYKEYRQMKVYGLAGYKYKETPTITLRGEWLRELGFAEGTPITVRCEDGRLTITRAEERAEADTETAPVTLGRVAEKGTAYRRR